MQHAGVDEGGIVKLHGDHLVILRRGRLFTVAVNDRQLRPVSVADAIAPATRIYRADDALDPYQGVALHSVSICDLARPDFACESTAVLGQPGRVFYVSPGSVYVWNVRSKPSPTGATTRPPGPTVRCRR